MQSRLELLEALIASDDHSDRKIGLFVWRIEGKLSSAKNYRPVNGGIAKVIRPPWHRTGEHGRTSLRGAAMAYKEVSRVDIAEVIRRWQRGSSQRHIASGSRGCEGIV